MLKMTDEFTITGYGWECFLDWLRWRRPEIDAPEEGCVGELRKLDSLHPGLLDEDLNPGCPMGINDIKEVEVKQDSQMKMF